MFYWIEKQDVIRKVQIGVGFMSFMMLMSVALSIWKTLSISEISNQVIELRAPTAQNSLEMLNGVNHSLAALRGWMILGQDKFKQERKYAWNEEILPSLALLNDLSINWTNLENVRRLQQVKENLKKFQKYQKEIENISLSSENLPANKILLQDATPLSLLMIESLTSMIEIELRLSSTAKRKKLLGLMANLRASNVKSEVLLRRYLEMKDKTMYDEYSENWQENTRYLDTLLGMKSYLSSQQKRILQRYMKDRDLFMTYAVEIFKIRASKQWNQANFWLATQAAPMARLIKEDLEAMVANQGKLQKEDMELSKDLSNSFVGMLWSIFFIMIAFTIIFMRIIVGAIQKPFTDLAVQNKKQSELQWTQEGVLLLNKELLGDKSLEDVGNKGLGLLCNYLNLGVGLLYKLDAQSKTLRTVSSFAHVKSDKFMSTFKLGEGTVGQVALQKKPLILEEPKQEQLFIQKGIECIERLNTYTYPLIYQGSILGVLELGSATKLSSKELELIKLSSTILATALSTAEQTQNIKKLLENSEHINMSMKQQKDALDAHSIVGITDIRGTITYANSKFSEVSGYSNEELVGANHRIVNSDTYDNYFWEEMYDTISSGKVWHYPAIKNKRKNGTHYWVDTTIFPFMGIDGRPESYIAIRTDVTSSKDAEVELLHAKEDAEQAVVAKADFLASMSHEIRTPMNGVIGMLDLLSRENLTKQQYENINIASSSAKSLLSVINDILDFSKIEAGKVDLEYLEFDIKQEFGSFAKSIAVTVQNHDVELLLDLTEVEHSFIYGDIGRIKQVLNNLVGNAIKFTHKGNIVIKAKLETIDDEIGNLIVSIEDSGIGIAEEKLATLFDAFTQADNSTTRKYGGTGLGLSIAKNLVQIMGGDLIAKSVLGEGSSFSFYFEVELSKNQVVSMPNTDIRGKKVLIVDDNDVNIQILSSQLHLWDMDVTAAFSAQEAIDICTQRDAKDFFDIAILDMQMPEIDGETLGKELSSMPKCAHMQMMMMTSYGRHSNIEALYKKGFNAFFMKPTTASDLYDALAVLVNNDTLGEEQQGVLTKDRLNSFVPVEISKDNSIKILLVEDNITNQVVAQGMLKLLNLKADIANNGQEAVDILQNSDIQYQVVLMDCQMPVLDGFETTAYIREGKCGEQNTSIPIIAMTANALEGDKERCLEAGMDDYISKPIISEVLREILFHWIDIVTESSVEIKQEPKEDVKVTHIQNDSWDEQDLRSRLGGSQKILKSIMEVFLEDISMQVQKLKDALTKEDTQEIQLHAHTIKGSAANLSALKLQALGKSIEYMSKSEDMQTLQREYLLLEKESQIIIELFREYLDADTGTVQEVKNISKEKIQSALLSLKAELLHGDFIDTHTLEVFNSSYNMRINAQLQELQKSVDAFLNDTALQILEEILNELGR